MPKDKFTSSTNATTEPIPAQTTTEDSGECERVFQHSMDHDERLKNCLPAGVSDDVPAVAVVAYLLVRRLLFYIGSIEWELSQQHWPDQTMRRAPHLL